MTRRRFVLYLQMLKFGGEKQKVRSHTEVEQMVTHSESFVSTYLLRFFYNMARGR